MELILNNELVFKLITDFSIYYVKYVAINRLVNTMEFIVVMVT